MNADDGAAAGRLPSIMLIQVALLAFFQSKEERSGKGGGTRTANWVEFKLVGQPVQAGSLICHRLSVGRKGTEESEERIGFGSFKSFKKVTDRQGETRPQLPNVHLY